ncbi:MAG: 5'/3'-nucleotidase SurE [Rectinemataceae bacterium]
MRLLLTNDDGVHAEGLKVLAGELSREHEICIMAPDRERSGVSHAMSLKEPGRIRRYSDKEYSCSGTPADCIILAGLGAVPFKPDAVVSGINRGANLGTDIVYSGTCGAARQASLQGLPAIAVSCASFQEPMLYRAAAAFVRRHLLSLLAGCVAGSFVNVNTPSSEDDGLEGCWAFPSRRSYRDHLRSFEAPDGYSYCFLTDTIIETAHEPGSDHDIVAGGKISVSSIACQPQVAGGFAMNARWS